MQIKKKHKQRLYIYNALFHKFIDVTPKMSNLDNIYVYTNDSDNLVFSKEGKGEKKKKNVLTVLLIISSQQRVY